MRNFVIWEPTKDYPKVCPFCGAKLKRVGVYGTEYYAHYRCGSSVNNSPRKQIRGQYWSYTNAWKSRECEVEERRIKWINNAMTKTGDL